MADWNDVVASKLPQTRAEPNRYLLFQPNQNKHCRLRVHKQKNHLLHFPISTFVGYRLAPTSDPSPHPHKTNKSPLEAIMCARPVHRGDVRTVCSSCGELFAPEPTFANTIRRLFVEPARADQSNGLQTKQHNNLLG